MKDFTTFRLDQKSNIFLIIEEHSEKLPLIVHGIFKVEGDIYKDSSVSLNSISDELCAHGYNELKDKVLIEYFQVD